MNNLLIIISFFLIYLNFGVPPKVGNIPDYILILEHIILILSCKIIIKETIKDSYLSNRYFRFFLISYCISIFYMYFEWTPKLIKDYTTGWDAFDPIKYYAMANESIKYGQPIEEMIFFPVSYVYYYVMKILGSNPLVPLFFNEVIFAYTICILSKYLTSNDKQQMKYYCWLFLIPEVICFNATSSKDILCLLCATIVFVKSSELVQKKISTKGIIIGAVFFIVFVYVRTSLAMASILGAVLITVLTKRLNKSTIVLSIIIVLMSIAVFSISEKFGTGADDITQKIGQELAGDVSNSAELSDQSSNSFARKIVPSNSFEFIVFGFIRSVCYIIIDPRFIYDPIGTLIPFNGLTMKLLVDYTTLLMFFSCFYIFFWLLRNYKTENKNYKNLLIVTTLYWYSVGAFNPLMIHVRYRLVYDILFFAIAIRAYLMYNNKYDKKINENKKYNNI